uniref:Uncharacterized protein n=1 Tax=Arundo donax TaxID=35708 RepID=A0A0A8XY61_ARUDO
MLCQPFCTERHVSSITFPCTYIDFRQLMFFRLLHLSFYRGKISLLYQLALSSYIS